MISKGQKGNVSKKTKGEGNTFKDIQKGLTNKDRYLKYRIILKLMSGPLRVQDRSI